MARRLFACTGAAAVIAGALLTGTPVAIAEDPACQNQQQPLPPEQQQQCDQGAGIANEIIDGVQQGVDAADQLPENNADRPDVGFNVILNGVPTCHPFGVPVTPFDTVVPVQGPDGSWYC